MASRIDVIFDAETRGLDRGINKVQGAMGGLGHSITRTAATVARFGAVAAGGLAVAGVAGFNLLKVFENVQANTRRLDVTFEEGAKEIRAFADEMNEFAGISQSAMEGAVTGVGSLLFNLGFTREEMTALSQETTSLALALSLASDVPFEQALNATSSALIGEREALKSLDIAVDEELVNLELARRGQENLTGAERSRAEVLASLAIITSQSADDQRIANEKMAAGGDASRNLTAKFGDLKTKLAEELGPTLQNIFTFIGDVTTRLLEGDKSAGDFSDAVNDTAEALASAWNAARAVAGAIGDITSAIGKVIGPLKSMSKFFPRGEDLGALQFALGRKGGLLGLFGRGRAHGGPVTAGDPFLVGERGPELFMPHRSGNIIPNGRTAPSTGVTINIFPRSLVSSTRDVAREVGSELQRMGLLTGAA